MLAIMSTSRVYVNELRQLEASAWTAFLNERSPLEDVTVQEVHHEALNNNGLVRYLLTFSGHSDPVPFVGKKTNAAEARFYQELGQKVRRLLPHCWLSHVGHDWSWIVLDDVPNHWPAPRWTSDDVEKAIALLASFHGAFWQQEALLSGCSWLSPYLGQHAGRTPSPGTLEAWRYWDSTVGGAPAISSHAISSAGRLAPAFIRAAAGLQVLRQLGGWPGVITRRHLEAIADLLDDPLPILQPLRELPATLLHGNPALHHWHVTLFNDRSLLDWANVTIGPPVCDLVAFLEQVEWLRTGQNGQAEMGGWPVSEETMIDSYLLRMHVGLSHFDARTMRQAIPAARCLYVLTTWLPRFADWFHPFVGSPVTWRSLIEMGDAELEHVGYGRLAGLRDYLAALFPRFWHAARSL